MDELKAITDKYDADHIESGFTTVGELNRFALVFFKDVAEIYDCITRIKNTERNPTGYGIDDAPILGLLARVWKLMKEVIRYYEEDNREIISVLERPLIEAAVTASFLMRSTPEAIEDYRKCSYKDRLRLLRDMEAGSPFFEESGLTSLNKAHSLICGRTGSRSLSPPSPAEFVRFLREPGSSPGGRTPLRDIPMPGRLWLSRQSAGTKGAGRRSPGHRHGGGSSLLHR